MFVLLAWFNKCRKCKKWNILHVSRIEERIKIKPMLKSNENMLAMCNAAQRD